MCSELDQTHRSEFHSKGKTRPVPSRPSLAPKAPSRDIPSKHHIIISPQIRHVLTRDASTVSFLFVCGVVIQQFFPIVKSLRFCESVARLSKKKGPNQRLCVAAVSSLLLWVDCLFCFLSWPWLAPLEWVWMYWLRDWCYYYWGR